MVVLLLNGYNTLTFIAVIFQKIIDYLLEKKFDLPNFTITHGVRAEETLKEIGLDGKIEEKNLLILFQLPKPLSFFWWKGGADSWGSLAEDIKGSSTEWGHFYRELMLVVWEMQGYYENEKGLCFNRLNEIGEHDPLKFYYVWEISA